MNRPPSLVKQAREPVRPSPAAHSRRAIAPSVQGPATLLALGALVVAAGVCVAAWGFARRPAELALAAGVAAVSFAVIPVHTLGWAGALTRGSLFALTAALALSVLIGTLASARGRARVLLAARSLGLLVRESALLPWRERSVALLGLLAVVALVAWTSVLTYYAPSSAWDGVMYHEPMVGFALQNHGFAWVGYERANAMLGPVDGYPRVTEDLMLFLVAAWDRRVIELAPGLMVPILLVATYVLLRRFVRSRASALGLACGLVLIPGVVLQLRSTYVDVTFVTFVAAAAAFLCRREPGPAELWMAGLSLGLVAGSKVTGLMVAPLIGALGVALAVRAVVRRKRPVLLAHLAGGFLLVCAIGGPTYARNWSETQNLTWPSTVQMEPLGIDWQGPLAITNMNVPNDRAIAWFFGPPIPNEQYHDTKDNGYGNVAPFLVPPLAALGLLAALWHALRGREQAWLVLALCVPLACTFALTPARHWARLNLHVVLAAWVLAAYWIGARRRRLLAEGAAGALIVGALVTLYWSEPAWDVDLERLARLRALPAEERALQRDRVFTLPPTETARARETELGEGDLVVFSAHPFVGLLWNERFSNRVEWIDPREHRGAAWLAEADARGAEWAVVDVRSALGSLLRSSDGWEEIGPMEGGREPSVFAFRRAR